MAFARKDRVKETSTTTGTGAFTLAGAVAGFQAFSVVGDGNTCHYAIAHQTAAEWEVGYGTYTASGTTLTRTTVIASSNSNAAVSFSAGVKDVFLTTPAALPDVQVFTSSTPANWNKIPGARWVMVDMIGAGGGGGGGASLANAAVKSGGSGGGGGSRVTETFLASDLPDTVSVTAGAAGSVGAGGVNGAAAGNGGNGGNTTFGALLAAYGGGGGVAGAAAVVAPGAGASVAGAAALSAAGTPTGAWMSSTSAGFAVGGQGGLGKNTAGIGWSSAEWGGATGSASAVTAITIAGAGSSWKGGPGGGAGAGTTNVPAFGIAGDGGLPNTLGNGGGGAHGANGSPGGDGSPGSSVDNTLPGSGGGGGGVATAANQKGGNGGNGGVGAGGGGGGAGTTTNNGGTGGLGGRGECRVYQW